MRKDKKVLRKSVNLQIVFLVTAVVVTALFWFGPYLYQVYAQFSVRNSTESPLGALPSGATYFSTTRAATLPVTPLSKQPTLGVNIANNGLIILRGARVVSSSNGIVRVVTAWDSISFTWGIQTKSFTEFITSRGEKEALEDVRAGDIVTITGDLVQGGVEPVIVAQFMRKYW